MKSTPDKKALFSVYASILLMRKVDVEWIMEEEEQLPNIDDLTNSPKDYLQLTIFYDDLLNDRG